MNYVVFATKAMIFENPFPNYKYFIKTPDIEVSVVYNDFERNLFTPKPSVKDLFGGITNHPSLTKSILL